MAIAVSTPRETHVEALKRQADALDRHAEQLRAQARDVAQQAAELRVEITRRSREPITIARQRIGVQRDLTMLTRITAALEESGPMKSTTLAQRIELPPHRVLAALRVLEQSGTVTRSGLRRGTIWGLSSDEDLNGHADHATSTTLIRDAARKLDTFGFEEIDAELPMLAEKAIRRGLRKLVAEGLLEDARDGKRKIWAYAKPEGPHVPRPKHEAPEKAVVELMRKRGPIQGTGKRLRAGSPVVDELLRELSDWPIVEIKRRSHKYSFLINGAEIAHCSTTPGASGLAETRRHLNRAGIAVRS